MNVIIESIIPFLGIEDLISLKRCNSVCREIINSHCYLLRHVIRIPYNGLFKSSKYEYKSSKLFTVVKPVRDISGINYYYREKELKVSKHIRFTIRGYAQDNKYYSIYVTTRLIANADRDLLCYMYEYYPVDNLIDINNKFQRVKVYGNSYSELFWPTHVCISSSLDEGLSEYGIVIYNGYIYFKDEHLIRRVIEVNSIAEYAKHVKYLTKGCSIIMNNWDGRYELINKLTSQL